jgi:hypothetical protein
MLQATGEGPTQVCTLFSESTALRKLFRNNPLVELAKEEVPAASELFTAALEEMRHEGGLSDWQVGCAAERSAFELAQQYVDIAPPSERARLQAYIAEKLADAVRECENFFEDLKTSANGLEPSDEVEIIRMNLEQARTALAGYDPAAAWKLLDEAMRGYENTEDMQRQARERLVAETIATMSRGFERLCTAGAGITADLAHLLVAAVQTTASDGVRAANAFTMAVGNLLAGRPVDRDLLLSAPMLSAPVEVPAEVPAGVLPELMLPAYEREPVHIDELPLLMRLDIEGLLSQPGEEIDRNAAWATVQSGSSGPARRRAAASLFRVERRQDGRWEELLEVFCEESGRQAFQERDYLRSAQYFLAATQVAYCACARLDSGTKPARDAARHYALARLMRLRLNAGHKVASIDPVLAPLFVIESSSLEVISSSAVRATLLTC